MIDERRSGVLLHITSLPSPYGIGNLGPAAYEFADFMKKSGLTYWQILPLNPVEEASGFSPYSGLSAFAGNPLLISPELLHKAKLIERKDLNTRLKFQEENVDFEKVIRYLLPILNKAFATFQQKGSGQLRGQYQRFCKSNEVWLDDFADYMAFKQHFENESWVMWPEDIRDRNPKALKKLQQELSESVEKEKFLQFVFFQQWNALKSYCQRKGVHFFGDIPFYVGYDSADVWSHPSLFKLRDNKAPKAIAGVPPDYFSETGQLWGMPVFDWKVLKKQKYDWWLLRIKQNLEMFDLIRLDHFRAFSHYWEVPAGHETAINGRWKKGPGGKLFKLLQKKYKNLPIIAEDLGEIDQPVRDLMQEYALPGMKVLHFAFGNDMSQSGYVPHHHVPNAVVYTGTHDNNTTRGWYQKDLRAADRKRLAAYLQREISADNVAQELTRVAFSSVCQLAVVPMQDLLNLDHKAIMNRPSTPSGNWAWRMKKGLTTAPLAREVKELNRLYDR